MFYKHDDHLINTDLITNTHVNRSECCVSIFFMGRSEELVLNFGTQAGLDHFLQELQKLK